MPPGAETLTVADVPSLWGAAIRLVLAVTLLAIGAGAWLFWQRRIKPGTRQLEILDRVMLGRGVGVALVRVDDRRLLVGVSTEGVRLIRDLESGVRSDRRFAEILAETAPRGIDR